MRLPNPFVAIRWNPNERFYDEASTVCRSSSQRLRGWARSSPQYETAWFDPSRAICSIWVWLEGQRLLEGQIVGTHTRGTRTSIPELVYANHIREWKKLIQVSTPRMNISAPNTFVTYARSPFSGPIRAYIHAKLWNQRPTAKLDANIFAYMRSFFDVTWMCLFFAFDLGFFSVLQKKVPN